MFEKNSFCMGFFFSFAKLYDGLRCIQVFLNSVSYWSFNKKNRKAKFVYLRNKIYKGNGRYRCHKIKHFNFAKLKYSFIKNIFRVKTIIFAQAFSFVACEIVRKKFTYYNFRNLRNITTYHSHRLPATLNLYHIMTGMI